MHTRRDQVQAYRFLSRRINAAVLAADPNAPEQPMRRLAQSGFASVMVAVIAVAVVAVIGLVAPGHRTSWRDGRSLILERPTGTRYVYAGGALHPVLNWTSGRLVLGGTAAPTVTVSAVALRGVPRGLPVGIPGAPDELPDAGRLRAGPWSVCSQLAPQTTGATRPMTELSVGWAPVAPAVADDQGLLVRGSDQALYLLWQGERLRLTEPSVVSALGQAAVTPVPVGAALLSAVPQGPDLGPVDVTGLGDSGPDLAGQQTVIGQVFRVDAAAGAGAQYYLLTSTGLRPLTPLQAAIQLTDAREADAYPDAEVAALPLPGAAVAQLGTSTAAIVDGGPAQAPRPVRVAADRGQVCAVLGDPGSATRALTLLVRTADPVPTVVPATEPVDATGGPVADVAALSPGTGALVLAQSAPGDGNGTEYLVTDLGVKYPLGGADVATALGYSGVSPAVVPVGFTQLLRTGPALSTAAARQEQPVVPGAGR